MALKKGGLQPNQAIVVENAPLGVRSAVAAGIFTVAVNTGILRNEELEKEGANIVYPSMKAFAEDIPEIISLAKK
jgi:beta-phosphoglucomutase-like phosphatase (HAD superfamily)